MLNELIFITHSSLLSILLLVALRYGKETLIALICLYGVLANLFVTKQIIILGLNATASDAYIVAAILGLNLLQEYFGAEITKKTIWISFFTIIAYTAASQIHLLYNPSFVDTAHSHFSALLSVMPRITLASIIVFISVQYLDRFLYSWLQRACGSRYFLLRNYASLAISQGVDTLLFSFAGLYGIVDNVWHIIIVSYTIKLCSIALTTPWLALSAHIMKKK